MMKAIDKLREITKCFKSNGFESAEKEAETLVRQGIEITTVEIYRDNPELNKDQIRSIEDMLEKRLQHEPFQYIIGYEEFMGLKLMVGPGVLIPRPETEFMVEQAIKTVISYKFKLLSNFHSKVKSENKNSSLSILDLCTGCGCLALALAKEFPDLQVYGTDVSEVAIGYAKRNAGINRIKNAVFLKGSLFQPVEEMFAIDCFSFTPLDNSTSNLTGLTFDLIISNPPYIRTGDIKSLQPEVKDWEPVTAIDGGADGLDFYRELIPSARRYLKYEGLLILELGAGQASSVADIIEFSGYTQIQIIRDYAGIERIIKARWRR
jgi:release factor glutamine methyltransferase